MDPRCRLYIKNDVLCETVVAFYYRKGEDSFFGLLKQTKRLKIEELGGISTLYIARVRVWGKVDTLVSTYYC